MGGDLFDVSDKVVLITGASGSLGADTARSFVANGAHVILSARRMGVIEALASELGSATAIRCDVSQEQDVVHLRDESLSIHGRVDVLINCAATVNVQPAEDETPLNFRRVVNINLVGLYEVCHIVGRTMLERGRGSIVNISSIYGLVGSGQIPQASYSASKGAVVNLTRELAAQWARRGVRVNAIAPAHFRSEMTSSMWRDGKALEWLRRKTPMGRAAEVEEMRGPILFLASDASSYVTGVTLPVDGGWTAV